VIDYVSIMKRPRADRDDLAIGEILKDLRVLGRRYGFHIISAAQIGRKTLNEIRKEGFDAAKPDSTSLRGSHEYSADADTIFALFPSLDEDNKLKIYAIKTRHSRKMGHSKELMLEASKCRIYSVKDFISDHMLMDFELELGKPENEIKAEIEKKKDINWAADLDNLFPADDTLAGIG
jgi:hypothetical protein